MTRLTLDDIFELTYSALIRCGATPKNAKPTAQSICDAEAEGIRNVGLAYLPVYCEHLLCGKVNGQAQPMIMKQEGAVIQVDADFGFCHPAFMLAFTPFVALTKQLGVSVLSIDRSYLTRLPWSAGSTIFWRERGWLASRLPMRHQR